MKVLLIIAQKGFRDEELFHTKEELEKEGIEVKIASINTTSAFGMLGAIIKPDVAVKNAILDEFDAIIVIGGSGSPDLANYEEVIDLVKKGFEKGKVIGAICLGPVVLAKAGVLKNKKATVWSSSAYKQSIDILTKAGAKYSKNNLVVDGKIITASGPEWARNFGKEIARILKGG
ncbi:MAG: DJ-1/PfpI family protein [Candidatus Nanoarchaeia archaeon]